MHYPNAIRNAQTLGDCRLIGLIALQDRTLSHEHLRNIARALVDRESEIKHTPAPSLLSKIKSTIKNYVTN